MWSLIVAIVIGFIAGLIARAIHPGNDKAGFVMTTCEKRAEAENRRCLGQNIYRL